MTTPHTLCAPSTCHRLNISPFNPNLANIFQMLNNPLDKNGVPINPPTAQFIRFNAVLDSTEPEEPPQVVCDPSGLPDIMFVQDSLCMADARDEFQQFINETGCTSLATTHEKFLCILTDFSTNLGNFIFDSCDPFEEFQLFALFDDKVPVKWGECVLPGVVSFMSTGFVFPPHFASFSLVFQSKDTEEFYSPFEI